MPKEQGKISFLPVTNILVMDEHGSRWVDLYVLMKSEELITEEEIAKVKAVIEKGQEARCILSNMKKYYEQEVQTQINGE